MKALWERFTREGSLYIVKLKMQGPAEVAFADQLFSRIETLLGLPAYTLSGVPVSSEISYTTLGWVLLVAPGH